MKIVSKNLHFKRFSSHQISHIPLLIELIYVFDYLNEGPSNFTIISHNIIIFVFVISKPIDETWELNISNFGGDLEYGISSISISPLGQHEVDNYNSASSHKPEKTEIKKRS